MALVLEGRPRGGGRRFAVVVSRFNSVVTERLLTGCLETLRAHGVADDAVLVVRVPGAFEVPQAAGWVLDRYAVRSDDRLASRLDGLVCLGCVVRGDTPHFDYVAGEAARGVARLGRGGDVPVTFGVVTANTMEQALDRAGGKVGNRGAEAALAALEMADLRAAIGEWQPPASGEP